MVERIRGAKTYCKGRAKKAKTIVLSNYDAHDIESSVKDMLIDIMHLCETHKTLDFINLQQSATNIFNAEFFGGQG